MNTYKGILIGIVLVVLALASGCATEGYAREDFDTSDFRCYGDSVAYCEGHSQQQMECTCLDDDQVRRLEQQLRGLY